MVRISQVFSVFLILCYCSQEQRFGSVPAVDSQILSVLTTMEKPEALAEIRQMQADELPRKAIASWLVQQGLSSATAYRWIAAANLEDENGNGPRQVAMEAMLDILYARQAAGDDDGVAAIASTILKTCK